LVPIFLASWLCVISFSNLLAITIYANSNSGSDSL
jgi:hypothetical protein